MLPLFAATLSIISLFKKLVKHFLFFIFFNYFYVLSFFHVFFVFLLIFILPTKKGIRSLGFPLSYFIFHCTLKTAHKLFIQTYYHFLPWPFGQGELGSERRETVRSLSVVGEGYLKGAVPSTRGPGWTHLWCTSCHASGTAGQLSADRINAESI